MQRIAVQHPRAYSLGHEERGLAGRVSYRVRRTGYSAPMDVWGADFCSRPSGFERTGDFSYSRFPGGESAIRECGKIGIALLRARYGEAYRS